MGNVACFYNVNAKGGDGYFGTDAMRCVPTTQFAHCIINADFASGVLNHNLVAVGVDVHSAGSGFWNFGIAAPNNLIIGDTVIPILVPQIGLGGYLAVDLDRITFAESAITNNGNRFRNIDWFQFAAVAECALVDDGNRIVEDGDLLQVGNDYDPQSPIVKTLQQRQAKMKLLEQQLDCKMAAYNAQLEMVNTELQSAKKMQQAAIQQSFSY